MRGEVDEDLLWTKPRLHTIRNMLEEDQNDEFLDFTVDYLETKKMDEEDMGYELGEKVERLGDNMRDISKWLYSEYSSEG